MSQGESYAINLMEVKRFHNLGYKGQGVKVAIFDDGVQKHEDLVIAGGFNAHNQSLPYDANLNSSHGTLVASIIAARDNDRGYLGVAPECELYAVRIDDGAGNKEYQFAAQVAGMNWAMTNNIDVIVCPFSGFEESATRRAAFKAASDAGIAIFCSAGNRQSGLSTKFSRVAFPSNYPFVITCANINPDKTRYETSSVGLELNFSSGGVNIPGATTDSSKPVSDKYRTGTGTSYATPAVAGMYCLYKNMFPNDSKEKILQRMYLNAERIGDRRLFGAGIPKFPDIRHQNIFVNRKEV